MILDPSGKPVFKDGRPISWATLRGYIIWGTTIIGGLALFFSNIGTIFEKAYSWIPKDAKTRTGFAGIEEAIASKTDLKISYPLIRVSDKCYYEPIPSDASGFVQIDDLTLSAANNPPFLIREWGGKLNEKYWLGFSANPRISGRKELFSEPIFELVIRNDGNSQVVISEIGVSINVKLPVPHAGPYEMVGVQIPFDEAVLDTSHMGYGDSRFTALARKNHTPDRSNPRIAG
jgi:hypothetical protein